MYAFAQNQTDLFSKLTVENVYKVGGDANHACPFAQSAIGLTKLIIEALHIGQDPSAVEVDLQPMVGSNPLIFNHF